MYGGYRGINIGFKAISYPKEMGRSFVKYGWEYVHIEFDDETNMIKLTPAKPFMGYHLTKHNSISARIAKLIPAGRYMCFEESAKEILFIRYGS